MRGAVAFSAGAEAPGMGGGGGDDGFKEGLFKAGGLGGKNIWGVYFRLCGLRTF